MRSVCICVNECTQAGMCDRAVKLGEEDGRPVITAGKQDDITSAVFSLRDA